MMIFLKVLTNRLLRKKTVLWAIPLVLLFSALPLPAFAVLGFLADTIAVLPYTIIVVLLLLLMAATQFGAYLMGAILTWVTGPGFITLSYTKPCPYPYAPTAATPDCNPIVGLGLDITQQFVNLLLVVVLIYVAFSIALRIRERDSRQLFFRLIVVALLVNFAPILVGLIVDAANIVMNYFLEPLGESVGGFFKQIAPFYDAIKASIGFAGTRLIDSLGVLGMGIAQIVLNVGIAFAFFLFAGLFLIRYIAIWILVILAPLAFVAWILPGTKLYGLWNMWWNQLIQWSIIGIPLAFFLYLAMSSFSVLSKQFVSGLAIEQVDTASAGILNQLFPFFVIVVFLFLGFIIGLTTTAMGTSGIIAFGKSFPAKTKAGTKWLGKKNVSAMRGIPTVNRAEEKMRRRLETLPGVSRIPGFQPGTLEKEKRAAVSAASSRLEKIPDNAQGEAALLQIARSRPLTHEARYEKAAALTLLAKRKGLSIKNAEAAALLPDAQRYGADSSAILKARPDFAPHLTRTDPATKQPVPLTIKDAMDKITPGDFTQNIQADALDSTRTGLTPPEIDRINEVVVHAARDGAKFKVMTRRMRKKEKQAFLNSINQLPPTLFNQIPNDTLNDLTTRSEWAV